MEFSKSLVLMVSLCCLLLSGINAVPTTRTRLLEEPPAAAPAPSNLEVLGLVKNVVNEAVSQHSAELVALCKDSEAPDLCVKTIAPAVKGALDPVVALETEIGVTLNVTLKVAEIIKNLRAEPNASKDVNASLDICADQYSSIVDTIHDSLDLIHQNDVYSAWMKFSGVISYQQACEDAFKEGQNTSIPFAEDSRALFQLGGNCLAILMRLSGETSTYGN